MRTILVALAPGTLSSDQLSRLQEAAPDDARVVVTRDAEEAKEIIDQVEIAAGWVTPDLLAEATSLQWYQQWSAGADWLLDHPELAASSFVLTSTSGIHAIQITEHIFAYLLAFARDLPHAYEEQRARRWTPAIHRERVFELAGKTLLLLGVGSIGRRTARVAAAMDLRVIGIRRDPEVGVQGVEEMFSPEELMHALPEADFVVSTLPLTEETRGMIGRGELRTMKETAIIVNVGRGGTIDEEALVEALQERQIAGAGLDVFETEPLPEDSPLWGLDNVIITSHYAGSTPHYHERALEIFLENLDRYEAGKPMRNVVDRDLGY